MIEKNAKGTYLILQRHQNSKLYIKYFYNEVEK